MKTPIEIRPSSCPSQARRRLACKILRPYVAPLSSSSRTDVKTQLAYLVDNLSFSFLLVYPTYCSLQRVHVIRYIIPELLQFMFVSTV